MYRCRNDTNLPNQSLPSFAYKKNGIYITMKCQQMECKMTKITTSILQIENKKKNK